MRNILMVLCALAALAGCATGPLTPEQQTRRDAIKQVALDRVEAFNAQGVDPVQLDGPKLLALQTACAMVPTLTTAWRPDAPEASGAVVDTCAVLMAIAPKAVPPVKPE